LIEGLAPFLTGRNLLMAMKAALALYPPARIGAMAALARQLSGKRRVTAWSAALEAVLMEYANDADRCAAYLRMLAPALDESLLGRCLDAALNLRGEKYQGQVLEALAPRLSDDGLARARERASAFSDAEAKAGALAALAPQLTGGRKDEVLESALTAALSIESPRVKAWTLAPLALHLTGANRDRAIREGLRAAESMDEPDSRAYALVEYLQAADDKPDVAKRVRRAMAEELHAKWSEKRDRVLSFCATDLFRAPMLSDQAAAYVLDSVMNIRDDWRWL
jgi:hypothetical protein